MISCKQSTEWVIKKEDGRLSVKENIQLMSHLAICSFCRLFSRQSLLINKAYKNKNTEVHHLTAEEKEELRRSLHNRINQ
jgi:predicted anti-sigma-YlaC factor YlaD